MGVCLALSAPWEAGWSSVTPREQLLVHHLLYGFVYLYVSICVYHNYYPFPLLYLSGTFIATHQFYFVFFYSLPHLARGRHEQMTVWCLATSEVKT